MNVKKLACCVLLLAQLGPQASAAPVDSAAVKTFEAGATLTAADLNRTVGALVTAANDNAARIAELEAAASGLLDIAERQYCLVDLTTGFFIRNGASEVNERQDDIGATVGSFIAGIVFNTGGTAVLNVYSDDFKDGFPNSPVRDGSDPLGQEMGTWTLEGNIVRLTFGDDSLNFALSNSGDVLLGGLFESDPSSDNSGVFHVGEIIVAVEVSDSTTCVQLSR